MENYIVGSFIKQLREKQNKTQSQLAHELFVSEKTISKWETGMGFPSITMVESLASALNVSVAELFNGNQIINTNKSSNVLKAKFYVCPICSNISVATGELNVSCCGIKLLDEPFQEIENKNYISESDGNICFNFAHPMTKQNHISFVAYVTSNKVQLEKLYPEQEINVCFEKSGHGFLYFYNSAEGLFRIRI